MEVAISTLERPEGKTQRRYKPEETRQRILEAARGLFRDRGYSNTSTADLAMAASVAEGSIYYHFGSKQALLAELGRAFARGMVAAMLGSELPGTFIDPGKMVERCFQYCVTYGNPKEMLGLQDGSADGLAFKDAARSVVIRFVEDNMRASPMASDHFVSIPVAAALSYAAVHEAMDRALCCDSDAERHAVIGETARFVRAACGFCS